MRGVSLSSAVPVLDLDTESNILSIQAVPGAVFLRLKREYTDGSARRMFVELTVGQAVALRRELDSVIAVSTAAA
jgi:hypothetical protein